MGTYMTKISLKNNNIVKQENKKKQIINTTSTTTTNKVPVTDNIVTSFVRYFKNCFQTPSAVVIDYSSNCKRTATSILTPGKNSRKDHVLLIIRTNHRRQALH